MEQVDRAKIGEERASRLVEEARRLRAVRLRGESGSCPVCEQRATVTDWRPGLEWFAIEGCPCGGFFVAASLLAERLPNMAADERQNLALRIRSFRTGGTEVWLTTSNGTAYGPLVVQGERPDRPR